MKQALLASLLLLTVPAMAAVEFANWSGEELGAMLAQAAQDEKLVMVVITQPDWCPGCIDLDRTYLRNPAANEVAELTREWIVLEMMGYDEPDAGILEAQGISFLGTPTTLLLRPHAGAQRLADARQLAAIVGFPEDYLARLELAALGHDAITAAQAKLRERNDVESLRELALAYLAAGDAAAGRRVFQSLLLREELSAAQRREIALQAVVEPTQRVEMDHRRTLEELDAWAEAFPDGRTDADYVYARAWSMLSLGEEEAAIELIHDYLESDDAGVTALFLYLAFRMPSARLVDLAEARAREAIGEFPEQAARFQSAHGRLLRRQGRLEEAEQAFGRAVAQAEPDDPRRETYLGQLEFVRKQRAAFLQ
jgi:thiol-disulfide isomerase/thioredoxin